MGRKRKNEDDKAERGLPRDESQRENTSRTLKGRFTQISTLFDVTRASFKVFEIPAFI